MKRVVTFLFASLSFIHFSLAQVAASGDYRSAVSGNWSDASSWQIRDNIGNWSTATVPPTSINNVYVQAGHTIQLNGSASCANLQANTDGIITIGVDTLNVFGKIRGYTGTAITSNIDDVFYTSQLNATGLSNTMITTSTGLLRVVGNTRTFINTSEWLGSGMQNCSIEFALNANQTATILTAFKFKSIVFASGIVDCGSSARVGADDGSGTGTVTIKSGARLISARSGTTSQVIAALSTTKCGTVTIENGGILELTGTTPAIDCSNFINNGTVSYNRAGTQNFLQKGTDATSFSNFSSYRIVELKNTSTKTVTSPITVSELLLFAGTASIGLTTVNTLTMLNGSTIERGVTSGTSISSTANTVFLGTNATDSVNVRITSTISNSGELQSTPTPGRIGTLTIATGVNYTLTGGRTFSNLVNNGTLTLSPSTSLTCVINGTVSGTGTITGNANASITLGGANAGNAGVLNFTVGSQVANNLTINKTGTDAFVTLGTPLSLQTLAGTGSLNLTAGKLNIGSNTISVTGNITGNGICTANTVGKILMAGKASSASIDSVTVDNLELDDADGFSLNNNCTITKLLTIKSGTLTTNNKLILSSSVSGTASIAAVTGAIVGNVSIQRYIPSGLRGFRFLSHPFSTAQTLTSLKDSIFITGNHSSFDATTTNAPSAFWFNNASNAWKSFDSVTEASWTKGLGVRVLIRGDRTQTGTLTGSNSIIPNAVILTSKGIVNTGNQGIVLNNNGFHLVGNPYPAPVNLKNITVSSDVSNIFYVWNLQQGTRGGYLSYPFTSDYHLPSGAAFFVNVVANNGGTNTDELIFEEVDKSTIDTAKVFTSKTNNNTLQIQVESDGIFWDQYTLQLNKNGNDKYDRWDGVKLLNAEVNLFSISDNQQKLGYDSRSMNNNTISLGFTATAKRNYSFRVAAMDIDNSTVLLKDKYAQKEQLLSANSIYNFEVTNDAASMGNERFELIIQQKASNVIASNDVAVSDFTAKLQSNIISNAITINIGNAKESTKVTVVNTLGQIVATKETTATGNSSLLLNAEKWSSGQYFIQVQSGKSTQQLTAVKP